MKTGKFDAQPSEYHKGNFSFAHEWLEEFTGLDEVLKHLATLRVADPAYRYLCTLDDVSQCSYTSGHASQDARLYLDSPQNMDWDDPVQEKAWQLACLHHCVKQLQMPSLALAWAQVCGTLTISTDEVNALLHANQQPDLLLDSVVYVQRLPVASDALMIAGQPNGYFSSDWDSFHNYAIISHLSAQHGYGFFGMGASWMGFVRAAPPSAEQARRLVCDLRDLYGQGHDEILNHAGWNLLSQQLQSRCTLMLGYTEGLAEWLGLDREDAA